MSIDLGIGHLRALVAVADAGSFTAAAARLHLAQSSLSRTVAEAERRLRVRLFERTTRRVEVTLEGREVVELARHMLTELDTGLRHLHGFLEGSRGSLTVAALPAMAAVLLPGLLSAYRAEHPQVQVQVQDLLAEEVLHRVRDGLVDLAVTACPATSHELVVQPVAIDRFYCVVPSGHRLADRASARWSDLQGEPFVSFHATSTSVRATVDRVLAEAGVDVGPVVEARTVGAVAGLTAAGLGVSVVPALVLPMIEFAGLRHLPLEPEVHRRICIVRHARRPLTPAARGFLDTVTAAAARGGALPPGASWHVPSPGPSGTAR